ncbi:MAG TPA: vitamin K epoxide reductase family protein [Gemmatimonadaceae bacterium]|nr:vitamin K epoxide reductase family protein [Gemmatimonadaceae bacterium]
MTRRNIIAVLSLAGVFLATYLSLYKLGIIGSLACGTGQCEVVQTSQWATLVGAPVALWGVGFYLAMFAASVAGSFGHLTESRAISVALVVMSGWGVLFSGWLTYVEVVKIEAICRWCVASAILVLALFVLSIGEMKKDSRESRVEG